MSWYADPQGNAREIDDALVAAWIAAHNPKAVYWQPIPARPSELHQWDGEAWVLPTAAGI